MTSDVVRCEPAADNNFAFRQGIAKGSYFTTCSNSWALGKQSHLLQLRALWMHVFSTDERDSSLLI